MPDPQPNPDLERLESEVAEIETVADSAIALIGGLSAQLRDHADDPARIRALADSLDAKGIALAAAVAANTPAAP